MSQEKYLKLKSELLEISRIKSVIALAVWDQATGMPAGGANYRGAEIAYLEKLRHEKSTRPEFRKLVDDLLPWAAAQAPDSLAAKLIHVTKYDTDLAAKLPEAFVGELSEHQSKTYELWTKVKPAKDFAAIAPNLQKTLELSQRMAKYYGYQDHPADPLIGLNERGMDVRRLRPLFKNLAEDLSRLLKKIQKQNGRREIPPGPFDKVKQLEFSKKILRQVGFDFGQGRLDESMHPFSIRLHAGDCRITTRVYEQDLTECLFSSLHECGHSLYESGMHPDIDDTNLSDGASIGFHESQSRLWENIIGRSFDFWEYAYADLQKTFPAHLASFSLPHFYQAINQVEPSLIRTEADEVTYNLHVMIRFELECELLEGALSIDQLPQAWGDRYEKYLGVRPAHDGEGCLQDMHWYVMTFGGYFQGYTLGNMYSAQIFAQFQKGHPNFMSHDVRQGSFSPLLSWLRENIHQHGRAYTPDELILRLTGEPLSAQPLLSYLEKKYLDPRLST